MHGGHQDGRGGRPPWPSELPGSGGPLPPAWAPPPAPPAWGPPPVPTSPTGRVPQWVLDQATGRPVAPPDRRTWAPPAPRRRSSPARALMTVAAVVALSLGAAHLAGGLPSPAAGDLGSSAGGGLLGVDGDRPPPGLESEAAPLGRPGAAPDVGGYAFVQRQADGVAPVAYDPCRPVHYVVALDGAPADAEALVADAVARVSAATGLRFVADGTTDEAWSEQRPAYQPERYGDRWAPVLVSWSTPEEVPELADTVAGLGGSVAYSAGGPWVYVSGAVTLDAGWSAGAALSPGGREDVHAVLMHELGHVVGLDHVDDPGALMHATNTGQTGFGPGHLAGLARLGQGECEPGL
ncbi:matrixin family metalloprotease [Geodermatophilus sp. FMUSA9-8]|uniref:matrixin family metalloprotease n=1 Tax=Geodermatophilus sp. FMUSA9-8 TaxID=3120155 RepID=UPI003009309E